MDANCNIIQLPRAGEGLPMQYQVCPGEIKLQA